ncbi:GntR family transcriptional regulator [Paenibacillus spongiae]|uniref:GntR family transcriptional regulator n=1 Tax=Paenibacillus spongiae TaxID=2909671 RepID=A0ABY5SAH8_9BACL|nr:GntR family transcriptional regulator [Paenibacillus spongiae]UVI30952.1 GntR family transcriptional regulator [Paenibacillus spongiae]
MKIVSVLKPDSKLPLYAQLKEILLGQIKEGVWQPGDVIPPETVLMQQYSVSRATIRQAINELVQEGYFTRHRGRGTFVNKQKLDVKLQSLYSFTEDMMEKGLKPESQVLELAVVVADSKVKEALDLHEHDLAVKLVRLRLANEEIMMLETTYLPYHLFKDLTIVDVTNSPLYTVLEQKYNLTIDRAIEYFEPILVEKRESKLLQVKAGSPALYLERIGSLADGTPVELSQSIVRGDRSRYFVELWRK